MNNLLCILVYLLVLPWISTAQVDERKVAQLSENAVAASVKNDQESPPRGDSKSESIKAVEEYEKEKLARMKKHIGKRFMAVRTVRPPEFYESPDNLRKKIGIKEKEEFFIMDVVQNQLGTMNFYKVRLESGKIGYLSADGNNLEIRIRDGSIISISKKASAKKRSLGQSKALASKAVELLKNHLTVADPVTRGRKSVEKRMVDAKARSFPNLKWRYEAKEIGNNKYRVTQYSENEEMTSIFRTWIVDLSTCEVIPENLAAKKMYQ